MTNAAIYWNPEAYDTSGKALMGRHSAGEGFMRGYIRHGTAERLSLWNVLARPPEQLEPLLRRLEPSTKPAEWIARTDANALGRVGVANLPVPTLGRYAWGRRSFANSRAYSLCGVTHTTVTGRILDALNELTLAPVQPWDAVVCTSRAVLGSVKVQAEMLDEYLRERLGAETFRRPQFVFIPLGIMTADFQTSPTDRARWRKELQIADDDVAVLYVGRFNATSKMNPVPMALALERAAAMTDKRVHWVLAGWADERREQEFRQSILSQCLRVNVHFVDGRPAENRFSIWSAGDIFLSLSDNMQETFGLTPVEAMAAGLPSVISDWDGYKDTVRHGRDGFRIATYTPAPGRATDLATLYGQEWISYDGFVGTTAQFTAIDVVQAVSALRELIDNPDLRRRMGDSALQHARSVFDWKAIIPMYEALWRELNARRAAAPPEPPRPRNQTGNPWRPDPFRMFSGYSTEWVTPSTRLGPSEGVSWESARRLIEAPTVRFSANYLPNDAEIQQVLEILSHGHRSVEEILSALPQARRPTVERGLIWMAKYGLIKIIASGDIQN
jgi:glycosyltransferase involved in cell wall biosynthesis